MIVCATWAQAENISTATHKATSCHSAAGMRVQSLRNANMRPESGLAALRRRWANTYLLVIEEVSMISPELFNMLLYRSFWGRKESWQVPEHLYNTVRGAFGRMPIVIMLGDFLQLRPTASNSLLDDLGSVQAMRPDVLIPAVYPST